MDNSQWHNLNDSPAASDQEHIADQQLEGKELLAWFGKAVVVLLAIILVVSLVIYRL